MIQTILSKILEELNKENPKLDYIRGMIEVLLAMQEKPVHDGKSFVPVFPELTTRRIDLTPHPTPLASEAEILDAKAKVAIETVKVLSKLE